MKKIWLLSVWLFVICVWDVQAANNGCFFESDCPKGYACVTAKGSTKGACQLKTIAGKTDAAGLGQTSIISDASKCTFNTDCSDGGQCIKQPGALYGSCQGGGYTPQNLLTDRGSLYKNHSCYFDQDCKIGQVCVKPQGSFKGMCEDDSYHSEKDDKDPRSLLKTHLSDKKCLADTDCGLREACVQKDRSVFGICVAKSSITAATKTPTINSASTSNDPFKSNSLFPKQ